MLLFNPAWADQWVGTIPVLNLILPAYLLSAAWLYAARRRAEAATRSGFWLAAFLAALIVGVALLVRQGFQGAILTGAGNADRRILRLFAGRPGRRHRPDPRRHAPAGQGAAGSPGWSS